jgi:hypothetical protein
MSTPTGDSAFLYKLELNGAPVSQAYRSVLAISSSGPAGRAARLCRRHRGGRAAQRTAGYRQRAAWREKFQGTKGLRMGIRPSQLA